MSAVGSSAWYSMKDRSAERFSGWRVLTLEADVETNAFDGEFRFETLELGRDEDGPAVATLISRRAPAPSSRAVLYVHGYADYFFQTHLADFYNQSGWDFYALDLRRCGRSLRPGQTPGLIRHLTDYFTELDSAAGLIRNRDGHRTLLVNGHSMGGLVAAVWADARRAERMVDGLFLNSPFVDFNEPWIVRRPIAAIVSLLARVAPRFQVQEGLSPVNVESIHEDLRGEWRFSLIWKPIRGFPVRAGWVAAIRAGQQKLRSGLAIDVPVLVGSSTKSFRGATWASGAEVSDSVLDVADISLRAPNFGPRVHYVSFDGAVHDLVLSSSAVRSRVFSELGDWIGKQPELVGS